MAMAGLLTKQVQKSFSRFREVSVNSLTCVCSRRRYCQMKEEIHSFRLAPLSLKMDSYRNIYGLEKLAQ
jgi:hypothetical protein